MRCFVKSCANDNETGTNGLSYFTFPRNLKLMEIWKKFCMCEIQNPKVARICSTHFKEDDIANSLQYKMGFSTRRILKPNAVPSLWPCTTTIKQEIDSDSGTLDETCADVVAATVTADEENQDPLEIPFANKTLNQNFYHSSEILEEENRKLKEEIQWQRDLIQNLSKSKYTIDKVQKENTELKEIIEIQRKMILDIKTKYRKANEANKNMQERLSAIFTNGQIKKLCSERKKRQLWSKKDIAQSFCLYSAGARTYRLLRKKGYPLPAVRTLQKWAQKNVYESCLEARI